MNLKRKNMIANYGFKDGSGDWYVTIDTDKCNGCGKCPEVCPAKILEVGPDEIDIFREEPVAFVKHEERKKVRYSCAPCDLVMGKNQHPVSEPVNQKPSLIQMDGNAYTAINNFFSFHRMIQTYRSIPGA